MPRVAPAARIRVITEALAGLRRLHREMGRFSQTDKNYESQRRTLRAAIQELRKSLSAR
jgi:hypothetical protein